MLRLSLLLAMIGAGLAREAIVHIDSKAQYEFLLQTGNAHVLFFHDGKELTPPQGEDDTREEAWFVKLAQIWPEVERGLISWARASQAELRFVGVDRAKLIANGGAEIFPSSLVPHGPRFINKGKDFGALKTAKMDSRRQMHTALQWLDRQLKKNKDEL